MPGVGPHITAQDTVQGKIKQHMQTVVSASSCSIPAGDAMSGSIETSF